MLMNPNSTPLHDESAAHNPIHAMREGEVVICSIKRHPIGIISIYASFVFLLLIVAVIAALAPTLLPDVDSTMLQQISGVVVLFSLIFTGIFLVIAHKVYYGNRWIVTSDSLTQVVQRSLFNTQSSQLSLANLEDVTVHQDGILAHIFNFGILKAETAGEHSKFAFPYCPDPNSYAQKILVARENFEQGQWYAEQRPDHRPTMPSTE